jgi:hypothetical protein
VTLISLVIQWVRQVRLPQLVVTVHLVKNGHNTSAKYIITTCTTSDELCPDDGRLDTYSLAGAKVLLAPQP